MRVPTRIVSRFLLSMSILVSIRIIKTDESQIAMLITAVNSFFSVSNLVYKNYKYIILTKSAIPYMP